MVAVLASPNAATAAPHAESDAVVEGTAIHQELTVWRDAIHFWFRASNQSGVPDYCVTLQLERKLGGQWEPIVSSSQRGLTQCCPEVAEECRTETDGYWDLFLYPKQRLRRQIERGDLRIRAFSDFGPSLALRLR